MLLINKLGFLHSLELNSNLYTVKTGLEAGLRSEPCLHEERNLV